MGNQIKTTLLLTLMTVFFMFIGRILGGGPGMVIALIFAGGMNLFSYWYSDKLVLKMYKASEISSEDAPELFDIVKRLAERADLPMPKVFLIPQDAPNAFATGRNPQHAVVAVTRGLLKLMGRDEIEGVLAHELGHVKNRDILIGTVAATMAGAVMMLANMAKWSALFGGFSRDDDHRGGGFIELITMAIIAPIAAMLIQMAISRSREYLADATSAEITGNPEGLASALEKLGGYAKQIPMAANPSTAHMFIANPLSGQRMASFFSTHPPIEERVARLRHTRPEPERNVQQGTRPDMDKDARDFWNRLS
ncbi:MAG: zinc metalloprotease HtpX [Proteobacteria bacterium]|nr:zinc metalloprotease HtpX [Pseudomonadota bacterium]